MKFIRLLFLMVCSIASLQAIARDTVPIVNFENEPIERTAGAPLTIEEVRQAILKAPVNSGWSFVETGPGTIIATLDVRGKHRLVTELTYSADKFSIVYRDSSNLKYKPAEGGAATGTIHPSYNRWVENFRNAIRQQLRRT